MTEAAAERDGLVEPEGVNAASSTPLRASPPGDARSGGTPEGARQMDETPQRDDIVGPPDQDGDGGPGQELAVGEG